MIKLQITDLVGQRHFLDAVNKSGEVFTVRVNSRSTVEVETDTVTSSMESAEKIGLIMIEEVKESAKSAKKLMLRKEINNAYI